MLQVSSVQRILTEHTWESNSEVSEEFWVEMDQMNRKEIGN